MFPLEQRKVQRGAAAHVKAGLGVATDYYANYVPFKIPFDGVVKRYHGTEGGNWLRLTRANGDRIELAHLSKYTAPDGNALEGQIGGTTGNTGTITTGPHLHIQIFNKKGVRIDPETYDWGTTLNKTFMKITILANKNNWTTLQAKLDQLKQWFATYSSGKFEPVFDIKKTEFDNVPLVPFQNSKAVDINWQRNNTTPLATGEATLLLLNPDQYQNGNTWGYMTYGDTGKPVRMEVTALEANGDEFVQRAFHEICHALLFLSGQPDVSPVNPNDALVHYYLYQNPQQFKQMMDYIDWPAVQSKLVTIKQVSKIKIRQVGWLAPDKEKGLYVPFASMSDQSLIISKINEVLPLYELDTTKEYNLGKRPF